MSDEMIHHHITEETLNALKQSHGSDAVKKQQKELKMKLIT